MPWYVLYDWVEVYNYDPAHDEFELDWRDDFNRFDQTRWHKGSGTFETNSSIFHPSNVYVQDGHMIIKMEPLDIHEAEHEEEKLEEEHYAQMHPHPDLHVSSSEVHHTALHHGDLHHTGLHHGDFHHGGLYQGDLPHGGLPHGLDGVHHREHGQLIHDAVPSLESLYDQHERPHGHLEPRHDLINEHSREYHVQDQHV